ncbi:MAG: flagellin [Clostridia bacterium]|jgi:flagellin
MRINHNIAALNTYRQLSANGTNTQKSLEKLSSGLRINKAGDDAAGLAISEKMRGQIRGLEMASKNAQDGISLIQTAEGALNETHSILQRMRELAVQSANDTNTSTDRAELQKEIDQLAEELTRIAENTEFNTQGLLDGSFTGKFHIGANEKQYIELSINNMSSDALGVAGQEAAVYSQTVTGTAGTIADGDYTVVSINDYKGPALASTDLTGGQTIANVKYVMVNADGNAVATSEDGKIFNEYGNGTSGTFTLQETIAKNGKVNKNGTSFTAEVGVVDSGDGSSVNKLATGEYKVADLSSNATYSDYGFGLVDKDGNVVALAFASAGTALDTSGGEDMGDATVFVDINDTNKVLLSLTGTHGLDVGDLIKVTGEGIDISNQTSANAAIATIQSAIETVSAERSKLGAYQNRLEHTINNLGTSAENLTAAESRIRDVDMAKEMMEFTKNNILSQAAQAMLAQANMQPQGVLQLLR